MWLGLEGSNGAEEMTRGGETRTHVDVAPTGTPGGLDAAGAEKCTLRYSQAVLCEK